MKLSMKLPTLVDLPVCCCVDTTQRRRYCSSSAAGRCVSIIALGPFLHNVTMTSTSRRHRFLCVHPCMSTPVSTPVFSASSCRYSIPSSFCLLQTTNQMFIYFLSYFYNLRQDTATYHICIFLQKC